MKLNPLYLNPDQIALILDCIEIAPDSEANCFDDGWYTSQNRRFSLSPDEIRELREDLEAFLAAAC